MSSEVQSSAAASSPQPKAAGSTIKFAIQQCLKASLKVVATENESEHKLEIGRGIIVYLCFCSGATEQGVDKAAKIVLNAKLSEPTEDGSEASNQVKSKTRGRVSIVDLPGDILVVPQATLGGRLKGNNPQYHNNCEVTIAKQLYDRFVTALRQALDAKGKRVEAGRYGSRQPVAMESDGPYTHVIEI